MDHRRRRAAQTRAGVRVGGPAEEGVGAAGTGAAQPGQVVSRRTLAALADWTVLAYRRSTAVDRRGAAGRPVAGRWWTAGGGARRGPPGAQRHRRRPRAAAVTGAA